jgi:hypothetical protein
VALAAQLSGFTSARLYERLAKHGLLKARYGQTKIPEFPEQRTGNSGAFHQLLFGTAG